MDNDYELSVEQWKEEMLKVIDDFVDDWVERSLKDDTLYPGAQTRGDWDECFKKLLGE